MLKEAQEREHDKVMGNRCVETPVMTWEASRGLEEGWEPRSRSRKGAAPGCREHPGRGTF